MSKTIRTISSFSFLAVVLVTLTAGSLRAQPGFSVSNGRLLDANDVPFVIRGVNHPHTWFRNETSSIGHIKYLGANTVRIVLSSGDRWTINDENDVRNVIQICKQNRLICMLEVHDTTGFGDDPAAATLDQAVDYWIDIKAALMGEEKFVLLNIGNEPIGNNQAATWTQETIDAIQRLRNEGFKHTIIVDAPNWGQDWTNTMRTNAPTVFAADPDSNLVFSVHMYGVYGNALTISDYLNQYIFNNLPIMIGEFGHFHSDGDVDEDFILSYSNINSVGYLGWSWSGNGGGVEYLDMALSFDPNQLTPWGERIFLGENGIQESSVEASVFVTLGDVNLDGTVNLLDVGPFVDRIGNNVFQPEADVNEDGVVNLLDVQPFVDILTG